MKKESNYRGKGRTDSDLAIEDTKAGILELLGGDLCCSGLHRASCAARLPSGARCLHSSAAPLSSSERSAATSYASRAAARALACPASHTNQRCKG